MIQITAQMRVLVAIEPVDALTHASVAEFKYRGREINDQDILYIRELIVAHPNESRRTLSKKLCEAWQWRQPNGALRDMVCRGLLVMLDRVGQIALPPVSYVRHNPLARARPAPVLVDTTPIEGELRKLQPLQFEQVRRTAAEPLFNSRWNSIIICGMNSRWASI